MFHRVAYHRIQGIDYFRFFDDNSSRLDTYAELQPWVDAGIITIIAANISEQVNFDEVMSTKTKLESMCKQYAFDAGFDLFFSLELDEYLVPIDPSLTAVEEMWKSMIETGLYSSRMDVLNFNSMPHILEPVNLLTIEAFQTRMSKDDENIIVKNTLPKLVLRLSGPLYNNENNRSLLIGYTKECSFHSCPVPVHQQLLGLDRSVFEKAFLTNEDSRRNIPDVFHYSRSLEKFGVDTGTWRTHSNDLNTFSLVYFLNQNMGSIQDNRAVQYNCQVRRELKKMTNSENYFRPGDFWYRNVEFGRPMKDGNKGKRTKVDIAPGEKRILNHPYHYHGGYWPFESRSKSKLERVKKARSSP